MKTKQVKSKFIIEKESSFKKIIDIQRYLQKKPAIYNAYYNINLIDFVDQIPKIINQPFNSKRQEVYVQKTLPQITEIQCTGQIIKAYQHQIDRLNQDVQINQYSLTNLLGRGAHSMVKLAKDQTGQIYAVKILWLQKIRKKFFIKQKQLVQMVKNQIQVLSQCKHKNIIRMRQAIYVPQKQRMFVVLQNCSQGTILKYMSNHLSLEDKQWWKVAKPLIKQLLQAIHFLHSKNYVHRDIKPQNVLVNSSNELKVIDFNMTKHLKQGQLLKISNKFIGTKSYAAPQLFFDIQKQKHINGQKVDMWALGISILQILQRKHPLPAKNIEQLQKMFKQQIKINPQYDKQLSQMISKMIAFDNEKRITARQALKNVWFQKN